MRIKNNIIMFFALIIIFSALFINYIIIKSFTLVDTSFISKLDKIYIDYDTLNEDTYKKISALLNSGNIQVYKRLLEDVGNPVSQFYGFCGFMKSNKHTAIEYIKSGIMVSPKRVTVVFNGKQLNSTLGYSIVLLLKQTPEWLSPPINGDFVKLTETIVLNIYHDSDAVKDKAYKNELMALIQDNYPDIAKTIINEYASAKDIADMNKQEKQELSTLLGSLSEEKRTTIIKELLKEKDETLLLNALNAITDKTHKEFVPLLENILQNDSGVSTAVKLALVEKYSLVDGTQALAKMVKFMLQNDKNEQLISKCLDVFKEYGTDAYWEFLTRYLGTQYSYAINDQVLATIITISWASNPDNVYKTFLFTIKRSHYTTAKIAIDFYIKNNLSANQAVILSRLRAYENQEMKMLSLKYMETFKPSSGYDILYTLSKDTDQSVQDEAKQIMGKLGITKQQSSEPQNNTTDTTQD